jgi:hypothetical protein
VDWVLVNDCKASRDGAFQSLLNAVGRLRSLADHRRETTQYVTPALILRH